MVKKDPWDNPERKLWKRMDEVQHEIWQLQIVVAYIKRILNRRFGYERK